MCISPFMIIIPLLEKPIIGLITGIFKNNYICKDNSHLDVCLHVWRVCLYNNLLYCVCVCAYWVKVCF